MISYPLNRISHHLERYDYKLESYAKAKFKITENQSNEDYFVYDFDDENITELIKEIDVKAKQIPYSMYKEMKDGSYADDEKILINYPEKTEFKISDLSLQGKHNIYNSMAAATTANILKIRKDVIRRSLSDFNAVEHRLEFVLKVGGVEFINDSKATNVNATYYALESMKNPTVWIVGGTDKGNDYSELLNLVHKKVKAIVCLGLDNTKIIESFNGDVPNIVETKSMEEAVRSAFFFSEKGDTVLLSPACASFDLFKNYEDRGNQFKEEVKKL